MGVETAAATEADLAVVDLAAAARMEDLVAAVAHTDSEVETEVARARAAEVAAVVEASAGGFSPTPYRCSM